MHTKDILAEALREAGLDEMAAKAATGYYHDYLSPLATPDLQLAQDLTAAATPAALAVRRRQYDGEFDATLAESDEWAASPAGREALGALHDPR